jgi:serine/threonine protein kinase/tetratricopeptide (TPR) repeat protein
VSPSTPAIGQTLGHYRILRQVGAGGMGIVFCARDQRLERDVALKVLPPGALSDATRRKRFRQEGLTLSRLNHPNIAHVYDFDTQDGIDFLVMEYVEGETLSAILRNGPLTEERVVKLGIDIASTLEHAHREGIVHCDIKPGNVIVTSRDHVKLLDFGLARLLRIGHSEATMSLAEVAGGGTLPYMAPEQLLCKTCDFRVDIYAVGALLYELVTGRQPFHNPISAALIDEILHGIPDPPQKWKPSLSPNVQSVIIQCLQKDPQRRYQSARELSAALAVIQSPETAVRDSKHTHGATSRVRAISATLLVLLVLFALGFMVRQDISRKPSSSPIARQLAVLPVTTVQSDAEATAFGNGLIETLTSRLARLSSKHSLEVIPASEIRTKEVTTLQEARQEFGVTLGLELNVQRAGGFVRVTYSLVDAKLHRQLNGDSITESASDPFGLQDKVAESVVKALDLDLQPQERVALTAHGTDKPAAYDYYLQGRGYLQDFNKPENLENAIAEFNRSVELDSQYALAFAGLGEAFFRKFQLTKETALVDPARSACQRAVSLQPDQAPGHYCLGIVYSGTGKFEDAAEQFKQATELDANDDRSYSELAVAYQKLGKQKEAEQMFRQAIAVRPNDWATYNWMGEFYLRGGRPAEAADMFSHVIALSPDNFAGYTNLGSAYLEQGEYGRAVPLLERSVTIRATGENTSNLGTAYFQLRKYSQAARTYESAVALNDRNYELWGNLGDAYYWAAGERPKARAAYQRAIELAEEHIPINPRDSTILGYISQYYAMCDQRVEALKYIHRALHVAPVGSDLLLTAAIVFNQLGDTENALDYLEQAEKAGTSSTILRDTPNFDNLHTLSRFQHLVGPS